MATTLSRIADLVEPLCSDLQLELYDLDLAGGVLKVVVDRAGGVDLDAIAELTRLLSRELDHSDPIPGRYTLEVTSPGLERNLRRPTHFERAIGAEVAIRTLAHVAGERRCTGTLVAADAEGFTVTTPVADGVVERRFAYGDVERAKTVFTWGGAPKPGGSGTPRRRPAAAEAAPAPAPEPDENRTNETSEKAIEP